jgi:hypothetical protein
VDDDGELSYDGRVLPELSNVELVARLRKSGCTGMLWLRAVDRFVSCGVRTLRRQIADGSVNPKLVELRRPVHLSSTEREHLRAHPEERDDLVLDAVFAGLVLLRDRGIIDGGWDPAKGADLMTYFVNACLLGLSNPVGTWRTRRAALLRTVASDPDDLAAVLADLDADPSLSVQDDAGLEALLATLPPEIADVARLVACEGVTWAEASRRRGVSPRLVEGHLRRYRRRPRRAEDD